MKTAELNRNEIPDALNLTKEVFFAEGNMGLSREAAKSFLEFLSMHGEELGWLGVYDGDLRGVLAYEKESCHLSLLFVRREDRGRKIGRMLVQALKDEAKKRGVQRITVNALPKAAAFYASLGFEKAAEEQNAGGMKFQLMEYLCGKEALGRKVTVTVDHPYGSLHPLLADVIFPCNYGYVLDDVQGNGDFQNAYVYGVHEPLESFTGYVIAVIYHRDEMETRWVVASGLQYDRSDVINTVGEIEQEYDTRFEWL